MFQTLRVRDIPRASRPNHFHIGIATVVALLALLWSSGTSHAHVSVIPREVPPNSTQVFTVRVPTEKESPTVRVRVEYPTGLTVSRFQPKPGWQRTDQRDAGNRIVASTWSGGRIENGEYDDFTFQARTPAGPGTLRVRAFQTYADGETVEWINPGEPRPAAVLEVRAGAPSAGAAAVAEHAPAPAAGHGTAAATGHAAGIEPTAVPTAQPAATPAGGGAAPVPAQPPGPSNAAGAAGVSPGAMAQGSDLPLFVALGSGLLALIALALAAMALSRRPPVPRATGDISGSGATRVG